MCVCCKCSLCKYYRKKIKKNCLLISLQYFRFSWSSLFVSIFPKKKKKKKKFVSISNSIQFNFLYVSVSRWAYKHKRVWFFSVCECVFFFLRISFRSHTCKCLSILEKWIASRNNNNYLENNNGNNNNNNNKRKERKEVDRKIDRQTTKNTIENYWWQCLKYECKMKKNRKEMKWNAMQCRKEKNWWQMWTNACLKKWKVIEHEEPTTALTKKFILFLSHWKTKKGQLKE